MEHPNGVNVISQADARIGKKNTKLLNNMAWIQRLVWMVILHHVLLWEPRWVICMRVLRSFIETKTSEKAFHFCSNNPLWYVKQTRLFLIITLPSTCHLKTIIAFHWIPTYPFLFLICLECSYFERCSHSQTHFSSSYLFI